MEVNSHRELPLHRNRDHYDSNRRKFTGMWRLLLLTSIYLMLYHHLGSAQLQDVSEYPMLISIPETHFSCRGRLPGYYADPHPSSKCQVYHMCNQLERIYSYLCPNFTLFHQERLICDHWYRVNCSEAESFYVVNENIYEESKIRAQNKQRSQNTIPPSTTPTFTVYNTRIRSNGRTSGANELTTIARPQLNLRQSTSLVTTRAPPSTRFRPDVNFIRNTSYPNSLPRKVINIRQPDVGNDVSPTTFNRLITPSNNRRQISTGRSPAFSSSRTVRPVVNNCLGCLPHYFTDPFTCTPCVRPR